MTPVAAAPAARAAYPRELTRWTRLDDDTPVLVRPIRAEDAGRLVALYARLSRTSAYQRFFTVMPRLPEAWARELADVDYQRRLALVAERDGGDGVELIGVARYEPSDEAGTVEVALVVEDAWQGHGLGVRLLEALLDAAAARGHRRFVAYVLGENRRMLALLARLVDVRERTVEDGVVRLGFARREADAARAG